MRQDEKILNYWILTTEYPPFFGGGISTYCHFTAKMLAAQNHNVTVFVNDTTAGDVKIIKQDEVRIVRFNPSRTKSSAFLGHVTNISYEFAAIVKQFIAKEGKPDIVEAQEYLGIAYYLLQYRYLQYEWCKDLHIVITAHSPSFLYLRYNHVPVYRYPNFWIGEMEKFSLLAADLVISPSQYLADTLQKNFGIHNANTKVIGNPYVQPEAVKQQQQAEEDNEIIFYGKLSAQKGTFKLLEYFSLLWNKGAKHRLRLIGGQDIVYHPEGKMMGDIVRSRYSSFIQQGLLVLEKRIRPEELNDRFQQPRLVVVPSTVDNLPYVVLELMCMGNILLVSKQGGQAEVIEDGVDGFVFDHENSDTFFTQLARMQSLTAKERNIISANACNKIKTLYHPDVIYKQKISVLEEMLRSRADREIFPFVHGKKYVQLAGNEQCEKGLLSIVVTFYNSGVYLDEVIKCIEESDYTRREVIIVNDGSNDPYSIQKLEEYKNRPGTRIISKENKGLGDTRNVGAEASKGEFLTFLDADDKVAPMYYSKAIRVLAKYSNVHFAGSWTQYFGGSESIWPTFNPEPPLILYHNMINSAALVYKRDAFLQGGRNDLNMTFPGLEDYESVVALLAKGYSGVALPELLFKYRVRPDSMVRGISATKKLLTWQYISEKHRPFFAEYADEVLNLCNANGPGIRHDNPTLDLDLADQLPFSGKLTLAMTRMIKRNKHTKRIAYKFYRFLKK